MPEFRMPTVHARTMVRNTFTAQGQFGDGVLADGSQCLQASVRFGSPMKIMVVLRDAGIEKTPSVRELLGTRPCVPLDRIALGAAPIEISVETRQIRPRVTAAAGTMVVDDTTCLATDEELVAQLADLGIVVAPGGFYGPSGRSHIRVALTEPDDLLAEAARRLRAH